MITILQINDDYAISHVYGADLRVYWKGEKLYRGCLDDGLILAMAKEIESLRESVALYEMVLKENPGKPG